MSDEHKVPSREDLLAVAAFASLFDAPGFSAGSWVKPQPLGDNVWSMAWWDRAESVARWEHALYERNIVDPTSDYLSEATSVLLEKAIANPDVLARADLQTVRTLLTLVVRAERFGDGAIENAFDSGMAQAATKRLGELAG